mmetsp:Transcript_19716/g.54180  ORF Transcript_19716/g.54180 Transcript_19716/m.54180 type:complete len:209 (-) Transcript_19716:972-1598(-)
MHSAHAPLHAPLLLEVADCLRWIARGSDAVLVGGQRLRVVTPWAVKEIADGTVHPVDVFLSQRLDKARRDVWRNWCRATGAGAERPDRLGRSAPSAAAVFLLLRVNLEDNQSSDAATKNHDQRDADKGAHGDPDNPDDAHRTSARRQASHATSDGLDAVAQIWPDARYTIRNDFEWPSKQSESDPSDDEADEPQDPRQVSRLGLQICK